ncbi:hypothetical protein ACPV5R_01090 [Vibrio astriarenae]
MLKCKVFFLTLVISYISGCNSEKSEVYAIGNTVYFDGFITQESVARAKSLLERDNNLTFIVESQGGYNIPAIDLANFIYDNNIYVIYRVQCYSACANYLLPATKRGVVKSGSIVGWHGGAYQGVWEEDLEKYPEAKKRILLWQRLETRLYAKLNVDPKINIYGIKNDFELLKIQPDCLEIGEQGNFEGWTYSLADLRTMGVHILYEDNEQTLSYNGIQLQCYIYPFQ